MAKKMVPRSEWLDICTTRIETVDSKGGVATGTGYFFEFPSADGNYIVSALVTNKHVLHNRESFSIYLNEKDADNNLLDTPPVKLNSQIYPPLLIDHPDVDVDLCIFLMGHLLKQEAEKNKFYAYGGMNFDMIPSNDELKRVGSIADIIMVGYPNGIWDNINNLPVIRKGITASSPAIDWQGRPIFLIDCACFPGSSGSPVFLYNPLGHVDSAGNFRLGESQFKFLGTLYAGPQHTASGEIKILPISQLKQVVLSNIPNNLGLVISSQLMNDFIPLINEKLSQPEFSDTK